MATSAPLKFRYPEVDTVDPKAQHTATVVLLHGLGDDSSGWSPVAEMLSPALPHVKWILPTAPTRPITCNGGFAMAGWYDIASLSSINAVEDEEGLKDSASFIQRLVAREADAGIPNDRVVVAGFSQGGAVAMMMLRSPLKLAGVVGLSTYLPLRNEPELVSSEMKQVPVFMAHGTSDQVVMFDYGKMSAEKLKELGCDITFKTYPMAHSACEPELQDVAAFLKRVLPPK